MNSTRYIEQLDGVIFAFLQIKNKSKYDDLSDLGMIDISPVLSKAKAAVARIAGNSSEYYKDIEISLSRTNIHDGNKLNYIMGAVYALKSDLENDYLKTFQSLVQAEVFSNYLEMAEYLEKEGYKDPAAVIIGSTLEARLRELCKENGLPTEVLNNKNKLTPKKADTMNAELAKNQVYQSAYQKQITAWLDIRNSAAHGKYNEYTKEEVKLMLQGVMQFLLLP